MFPGHAQAPPDDQGQNNPSQSKRDTPLAQPGNQVQQRADRGRYRRREPDPEQSGQSVEFEFHVTGNQRQHSRQNQRPPQREQYEEGTGTQSKGRARSGSKPVENRDWHQLLSAMSFALTIFRRPKGLCIGLSASRSSFVMATTWKRGPCSSASRWPTS